MLSIIRNETYAGVRHVGKRGKGTIIKQEVPAIVSRETWELAQKIAKSNWSNAPRNAKRDYLLRGLMFCGVCGRRYIGVTTNNVAYYKCGRQGCTTGTVPCNLAEQTVWNDILRFVHNPGPVIEELQEQIAHTDSTSIQIEYQEIATAILRLAEERQRILYLIRKGLVSEEEGDAQLIATGRERDILEARKASLEAQLKGQEGQRAQLTAAEALLRDLREKAESADNNIKRQVIETLVAHVPVNVGENREIRLEPVYRFENPDKIANITSTPKMRL